MGNYASAAVFYALFIFIAEIAAATVTQSIKGAETKKTVEFLRILYFVAGEKFALLMLEKPKLFFAAFAAFIIVFHFFLSPSLYFYLFFFGSILNKWTRKVNNCTVKSDTKRRYLYVHRKTL